MIKHSTRLSSGTVIEYKANVKSEIPGAIISEYHDEDGVRMYHIAGKENPFLADVYDRNFKPIATGKMLPQSAKGTNPNKKVFALR